MDHDYTENVKSHEGNTTKKTVWTKKATRAMISLYESKIQMLNDIGKHSQVWKEISDGLKDLSIEVTADQVKWKFNRLNTKYKECIDNNNIGRAHMTFEYYEEFEEIFHKEKKSANPQKKKRKYEVTELTNKDKKKKLDDTSSENDTPSVDESQKYKTSPEVGGKKNKQLFQILQVLQQIHENQKSRDEKMTKYLKMKEREIELKMKSIEVREIETQVKRDVASEKLKLLQTRHHDWLSIEKLKCRLLKKLLKNNDSGESD